MFDALSADGRLMVAAVALVLAQACGDASTSGGGGAEDTTTVQRVLCGTDSTCTELVHDSSGRVLSETHYGSCDGTCAERDTYTYDAGPNPTSKEVDRECDGSTDWATVYTYDASGRIATTEYDDDGDGTADGNSCSAYEDAAGEEIERLDVDCDGSVDRCWARTRDANGRVVTERELVAPECMGGSNCRTYGYDATGWMSSSTFDSSCDGTNEDSSCYEYQ